MFCNNCGNNLPEGSTVCPVCGASVQQPAQQPVQQPAYQQPAYQQPVYPSAAPDNSGSILTFGILSLALCWVPVLGLIFAIIGMKKSSAFAAANGQVYGKAKVGRILSIVGLVASIIMMVYWLIVIIACGVTASSYSRYYYY